MQRVVSDKDGNKAVVGKEISIASLTSREKYIWDMKEVVLKSIGGMPEGYILKLTELIDY